MKKFFAAAMLIMGTMSGMNAAGFAGVGYGSACQSATNLSAIAENNSENTDSELHPSADLNTVAERQH